ncbi:hypothetical protein SCH01S_50_00140 [Sphingomonas changbaiensis NBRC 104936]|uniref:Ice-binding protein C-terminal domain-containing protein n=1 Tax=Sphingomonas changbaiensis NBRC 104936 TaxID=1219043 RepID=A0A0E9MS93_9SPHN|nr:PEPxxWA-CTERM sorting domain-containing protein [Sphingomonas changbaiensis]GAO40647.1 hypothetical protein SCH01S_50_00140 [Sphingomonas changbaiensis NBRC 104936]
MINHLYAAAAALLTVSVASSAQAATDYNSTPASGWHYGSGNDYAPANTAVLTTVTPYNSDQLYLRWHKTGQVAPASDSNGVYSFALGTTPISFDWGFTKASAPASALITITNLGTAQSVSYDPLFVGNDNYTAVGPYSTTMQNSARLTFAFLSGVGFNPNINDTYRVRLDVNGLYGGTQSLSVDAQIGTGVPEPATWALMLVGFGAAGLAARRSTKTVRVLA